MTAQLRQTIMERNSGKILGESWVLISGVEPDQCVMKSCVVCASILNIAPSLHPFLPSLIIEGLPCTRQ